MQRRKIVFVSNNARMMYVFRREMLEAFSSVFDVTLISPKDVETEKWLKAFGIHFIACSVDRRGVNPLKDALLTTNYYRILNREKPDVVFTFTIKPNIYAGLVCQRLGIPVVATVEGLGSGWGKKGLLSLFIRRLYAIGLRRASAVFVLNRHIYEELLNVGIAGRLMHFLPGMGVNLNYFTAQSYPKDDSLRLLTVGRIMREKGFLELIDAARQLQKDLPRLEWHVVGSPETKEEGLLEELKKCANVVYHGLQSDVRPFYAMCHATVTTTYHEGMSTVCLESAASARPILGTNVYGVKETFLEGVSGLRIRKGDAADTVRIIRKFFSLGNAERAKMGCESRVYAEKHFDRNKVTWSYFTVLQSVYAKDAPEALDGALASIEESTQFPESVLVKEGALPEHLEHIIRKWQKAHFTSPNATE